MVASDVNSLLAQDYGFGVCTHALPGSRHEPERVGFAFPVTGLPAEGPPVFSMGKGPSPGLARFTAEFVLPQ